MANLTRLYETLHFTDEKLGREGWQLLPVGLRAPNRLRTPSCETCQTDRQVETITRTETHVHFRCAGCGRLWVVPKPGVGGTDTSREQGSTATLWSRSVAGYVLACKMCDMGDECVVWIEENGIECERAHLTAATEAVLRAEEWFIAYRRHYYQALRLRHHTLTDM